VWGWRSDKSDVVDGYNCKVSCCTLSSHFNLLEMYIFLIYGGCCITRSPGSEYLELLEMLIRNLQCTLYSLGC